MTEQLMFDIDAPCGKKAIKVIDDDARRIGAYATVWGELDCDDDRMTQKAIEPYLGKGEPFMFWLHGLDETFGSNVVGKWDNASFKIDPLGLYVEGNVSRDSWGDLAWNKIKNAGAFGLSVGSFWYLVKKRTLDDGTKEITNWPLLDISLMEGGKQCVPSARNDIKSDIANKLMLKAMDIGVVATTMPLTIENADAQSPAEEYVEVKIMTEQAATVNIEEMVAQQLKAALAKQAEVARQAEEREAEIQAKAEEIAAKKIEELKAEIPATKTEQPKAPVTAKSDQPRIQVGSPLDRLDTFDMCLRYELLKHYGRQPSIKMWRALAERAVKITREKDQIGVKMGQPVMRDAVDWQYLTPRNLDLNEIDADPFDAAKAGQFGRVSYDLSSDAVTPRGLAQLKELGIKANELVYSTQASGGDEWVPTLMNAQLWRTVRLNAAILSALEQFDMPSQPFDYPTESTDPVFYKVSETTDESQLVLDAGPFTDSKPATAKITFSAGKLGAISYWSEEMEEDSIIAFEPQIRDQYGIKFAHVLDEVLLSGDESTGSSNISYDGASIGTTSHFLTVDGLRHEPLITTSGDSRDAGTLTVDDFGLTRALMGTAGKFGAMPSQLVIVMDPGVWHKTYLLSEVLTVNNFGSGATIITGQVGEIFGIPLIVSEDYSLTDTAGKISSTGGNNTLGSFVVVNLMGVKVGWRRRPRIRVVGLPGADARYIVGSARLDIGFKEAGMVGMSYNITV